MLIHTSSPLVRNAMNNRAAGDQYKLIDDINNVKKLCSCGEKVPGRAKPAAIVKLQWAKIAHHPFFCMRRS